MAEPCEIAFRVSGVPESPFQPSPALVAVTGSVPQLGSWNPEKALKLREEEDGSWSGKIPLVGEAAILEVEYKYVLVPSDDVPGVAVWEDGTNRISGVPLGFRLTVNQSWATRETEEQSECIAEQAQTLSDGQDYTGNGAGPVAEASGETVEPEVEEPPLTPSIIVDRCNSLPRGGFEIQEISRGADEDTVKELEEEQQQQQQQAQPDGAVSNVTPSAGEPTPPKQQQQQQSTPTVTPLDFSLPRPKPRNSTGGRTSLSVSSERANMWVFPVNGIPHQEEQSQLFSATQMNYSQMALETLACGLRALVIESLHNPKHHLNFVEGPKGTRLRADSFTCSTPDATTTHPAVLLKYLQKEKAQFLKPPFVLEAHQRLLRAAYGVTAVGKTGSVLNGSSHTPRGPLSPTNPVSPGLGSLPPGLISPDVDGAADVVEDAGILLKHLSEVATFRNGVAVKQNAKLAIQYALSNILNITKVRDSLDQNSLRLETICEDSIEQRRVFAQDLLAQCAAQLDRDDVLEAVIDGLACRVTLR